MLSAVFSSCAKSNILLQQRYSHSVDKSTGMRSDQTVILSSFESASVYSDPLRRVNYYDAETNKGLTFLTKWIKQHLRIKAFYGTSENAVKTQIWSVYVPVAIVRKRLRLEAGLSRFYRFSASRSSRKGPFYASFRPSTRTPISPKTSTN